MLRTIALAGLAAPIATIALCLAVPLASPARAQGIGTIFSDPVPRPPANIPRGNQPPPDEEEDVPTLPQGRVLPAPNRAYPGQMSNLPGRVQSQPLAPLPGATALPPNAPPPVAVQPPQPGGPQNAAAPPGVNPTLPGLPPGQRQPRGTPQPPASLQPGDEIVQEPPAQKIINKKASFSGLDKITGRVINFDEAIGETVQFGALRVKTDACYTRPATEAANTDAFVEVDEITLQGEVKRIFSGWMFAASPGLHAVEHPIYDVWLTDCKDPETTVVTAAPEVKPASPPVTQKPPVAQKRPPPRAPRPQPPRQQEVQQAPPPPPPPPPPRQQPGGLFGIFR
ncbi:MAG TPA: DUF2155 domain-containing protein [Bradyrhizobium sp.]|uniref:DUF2155 domain-containing protein n=1 Tax=Bradyrhizobium sp. TaxID=376 RepID=UPI002B9F4AB5|nr:DUF2155 domain-containing protein [Bradyrhizobium sp.]HLZ02638.1 DUF2155 domain-containing protein [Bradyrhizobium sp.]